MCVHIGKLMSIMKNFNGKSSFCLILDLKSRGMLSGYRSKGMLGTGILGLLGQACVRNVGQF